MKHRKLIEQNAYRWFTSLPMDKRLGIDKLYHEATGDVGSLIDGFNDQALKLICDQYGGDIVDFLLAEYSDMVVLKDMATVELKRIRAINTDMLESLESIVSDLTYVRDWTNSDRARIDKYLSKSIKKAKGIK